MTKSNAARHDLADSAGGEVLIVIMEKDAYGGGADKVKPDPDQPSLLGDSESEAA